MACVTEKRHYDKNDYVKISIGIKVNQESSML